MSSNLSLSSVQGINLCRGILAILVVIAHALEVAGESWLSCRVDFSFFSWWKWITPGGFWVGGFFVISGYCIGLSVKRNAEAANFSTKKYLKKRFFRIYPLYFIALVFSTGLIFVTGNAEFSSVSFFGNIILVQSIFTEPLANFGHSWSISYEMFYYLTIPVLWFLAKGDFKKLWIIGAVTMFIATLIFGVVWKVMGEPSWMTPFWNLPWSGVMWIVGLGMITYQDSWSQLVEKKKLIFYITLWVGVLILVGGYCYRSYGLENQWPALYRLGPGPIIAVGFGFLLLSLEFIPLLGSKRLRVFSNWLGDLSYPLYLFHLPIQWAIWPLLIELQIDFFELWILLCIIPIFISSIIGVYLERKLLNIRKTLVS